MYNIWFYLFFWILGVLLALPILVISVVWIISRNFSPSKNILPTLNDIRNLLENIKNETDFRFTLQKFLKHFKIAPSDKIYLEHWLPTIERLASSKYFDTETLVAFGKELEEANYKAKQDITNIINSSLKDRRKK